MISVQRVQQRNVYTKKIVNNCDFQLYPTHTTRKITLSKIQTCFSNERPRSSAVLYICVEPTLNFLSRIILSR